MIGHVKDCSKYKSRSRTEDCSIWCCDPLLTWNDDQLLAIDKFLAYRPWRADDIHGADDMDMFWWSLIRAAVNRQLAWAGYRYQIF